MKATSPFSRRHFCAHLLAGTATLAWPGLLLRAAQTQARSFPAVALFSKVCQEIQINPAETASLIADAGLDGIDCPVRPGGQVLPERVAEDLPRMAEALEQQGKRLLLLTTGIQSLATPHAETILRTAAKLGVKFYRLGYWKYRANPSRQTQLEEIRRQLQDLAALNRELGICAVLQNHAGQDLVGAKVRDLYEIASGFAPTQVAIAFDIGHALNELPDTWRAEFQHLRSHLGVAYVKDWKRTPGFVPFGTGDIGGTEFFRLLKAANYQAPISMHTEYHWAGEGQPQTKAALRAALQRDLRVLRGWWAED